jgi:peroxiredoxin (alkyl hydroperoxide reductase subunit C)
MPEEFKAGCQRPAAKNPPAEAPSTDASSIQSEKERASRMIKVGKPAPDFTLPAFIDGKFAQVSLSEYKGQWISLCFYPGDFTFV